MPSIVIRAADGTSRSEDLFSAQPTTIGSHPSCDVVVAGDGVGPVHCRIGWNQTRYEVTAGTPAGVDHNGNLVRQAVLADGDVVRVGDVDIEFSAAEATRPMTLPDEPVLAPPDEEQEILRERKGGAGKAPPPAAKPTAPVKPTAPAKPTAPVKSGAAAKPGTAAPAGAAPAAAVAGGAPAKPTDPQGAPAARGAGPERAARDEDDDDLDEVDPFDDDDDLLDEVRGRGRRPSRGAAKEPPGGARDRVRAGLRQIGAGPVRPGEQDIVRSPLTMILTVVGVVLSLTALVAWFWIGRILSGNLWSSAEEEFDQAKYSQALQQYEKFAEQYPRHENARKAKIGAGKCRVLREIVGGAPAWDRGLESLQDFVVENRDQDDFAELQPAVREYAEQIVLGAAKTAETTRKREPLVVAEDARKILDRFPPEEAEQKALARRIRDAFDKAEAAIRRRETFDASIRAIQESLDRKEALAALAARRTLLDQYADFAGDPQLAKLLDRILDVERGNVRVEQPEREALVEDHPRRDPQPLVLAPNTRARTDQNPSGRLVVALAQDCVYGLDAVTGEPVWRRVVGSDPPFLPRTVSARTESVLLCDVARGELVLLERDTGTLVWRQPLEDLPSGEPVVDGDDLVLATRGGRLLKFDLDSGRLSQTATFSQPVLAPPLRIEREERLVLLGEQDLFYVLDPATFECRAVTFVGQRPTETETGLLEMGPFLLQFENQPAGTSVLRVFDAARPDFRIVPVAEEQLDGPVRDRPAIRGPRLFVPVRPERVTVFQLSDDPQRRPIAPVASQQVTDPRNVPMFLLPGPDDRLWLASTALRQMTVAGDVLRIDPGQTAVGRFAQPLQTRDGAFFAGRRSTWSDATYFSKIRREDLAGEWRTILGSRWLEGLPTADGQRLVLNRTGQVFRIGPKQTAAGGFERQPLLQIDLPDTLSEPILARRTADGRLVVAAATIPPHLWVVNAVGQIEREFDVADMLQTAPVGIREGIVAPLPGRLRLLRTRGGAVAVEDFRLPIQGASSPRWKHVVPRGQDDLLADTDRGTLLRIELRNSPQPHLAEAAQHAFAQPLPWPPLAAGTRVVALDATHRLAVLDGSSLEPRAERRFDRPATNPPFAAGDSLVLVETARETLEAVPLDDLRRTAWTLPLAGGGLAGAPLLHDGRLWIAERDGTVTVVDPGDGRALQTGKVGQSLTDGPVAIGTDLVVPTIDGSAVRIADVVQE